MSRRKAREEVEFEVPELSMRFRIKHGCPLTFCEVYRYDDEEWATEFMSYGVSNCRTEERLHCRKGEWVILPGDTYDPVKGAKLALRAALTKILPNADDLMIEKQPTIRAARQLVWDEWKKHYLTE